MQTIHGWGGDKPLEDGRTVVIWTEMANPVEPGKTEGFYCSVDFRAGLLKRSNAEVVTLVGDPDLIAVFNAIKPPKDWCSGWRDNCKRFEGFYGWSAYP